MKIIINENKLPIAPEQILRQTGYVFIIDRRSGQESFVRRPGRNRYPRFHLYVESQGENIIFNLHLDQKEASYPGAHAHNAEYDGEKVEQEILRLKVLIKQIVVSSSPAPRAQRPAGKEPEKASWLSRIFG